MLGCAVDLGDHREPAPPSWGPTGRCGTCASPGYRSRSTTSAPATPAWPSSPAYRWTSSRSIGTSSATSASPPGVRSWTPGGLAEVADEVPIDLEDVHRYAGELGQAGVAGAEVVERDLYPGLAQVPHRPVGPQDGGAGSR